MKTDITTSLLSTQIGYNNRGIAVAFFYEIPLQKVRLLDKKWDIEEIKVSIPDCKKSIRLRLDNSTIEAEFEISV